MRLVIFKVLKVLRRGIMAGLQNTVELKCKHVDKVNTGDLDVELFPTREDSAKYIFKPHPISHFLIAAMCLFVSRGWDMGQVLAAQILKQLS